MRVNDQVFVRKELNEPLKPARVTHICDRPRSYKVQLENNKVIERNRRHIFGPIIKEEEDDDNKSSHENPVQTADSFDTPQVINSNSDNNNTIDVNCNSSSSATPKTEIRTRYGRIVNPPKYLADYQCSKNNK